MDRHKLTKGDFNTGEFERLGEKGEDTQGLPALARRANSKKSPAIPSWVRFSTGLLIGAALLWPAGVQAYSVKVSEPVVNLRAGPAINQTKVGEAKAGTTMEVLAEQGDWLKIRLPSGQEAWVAGWLVEKDFSGEFVVTAPMAGGINIRTGPGTNYSILARTESNVSYPILGAAGKWLKIRLANGAEGWVAAWLTDKRTLELKDFSTPTPPRAVVPVVAKIYLRALPQEDSAILATIQSNTVLTYLESRQGWHKVSLPGPVIGWVDGNETKVYNRTVPFEMSPNYWLSRDTWAIREYPIGFIKEALVNLRQGPGTGYALAGRLTRGTSFKIYESAGEWYRIVTDDGRAGWVAGWLTGSKTSPRLREAIYQRKSTFEKSLVLRGNFGGPAVIKELDDGRALAVYLGSTQGYPALLDVNSEEVDALHLTQLGLLVRLKERAYYQVARNTASEIVINFSGLVESVSAGVVGDRRVITFQTRGYVEPEARVIPGQNALSVTFPGVAFSGKLVQPKDQVIKNLVARRDAGGVTFDLSFEGRIGWAPAGAAGTGAAQEAAAAQGGSLNAGFVPGAGGSSLSVASGTPSRPPIPGGPSMAGSSTGLAGAQSPAAPASGLSLSAGSYLLRRSANQVVLEMLPRGLKGKIILLDPGHGGPDPGAKGPTGLLEKIPNLEIALRLKALLEKEGARVIMTRSTDSSSLADNRAEYWHERVVDELLNRSLLADRNRADLLLSIHNNANDSQDKGGTATYFAPSSFNLDRSQYLAALVQEELVRGLGRQDNGVKQAEFFVLKNTTVPSALAEVVFVSNPQEEVLLRDPVFLDRVAGSLGRALKRYFGE